MARRKKGSPIHGWINLDKPEGLTSTQAVGKARRILNAQKVGHAGTLDPLASGILPIALGEATKTIPYVQDALKTYEFTVTWGEQRSTDDSEGEVIASSDVRPSQEQIESILEQFTGKIEQTPPKFSAIKIDGQRAYDLARDGEEFEIKSRVVYIESLEITPTPQPSTPRGGGKSHGTGGGETSFTITCGKGTYVRSLARDMAIELGTYGYVSQLRRTAVGPFTLDNAISLDKLEKMRDSAAACELILPVDTALDDIPAIPIRQEEASQLKNGQSLAFISRPDFQRLSDAGIDTGANITAVAVFQGNPVALVEVEKAKAKPVRVFNL